MILSRTPFRISFLGGGTDYPEWFREHSGSVLSTTIDKYCYVTIRHLPDFYEHTLRVVYSESQNAKRVEDIHHPTVRQALTLYKVERGLEIHHDGDLPAGTGMGSSSAFTVGLLNALHFKFGTEPMTSNKLARLACFVEQELLKECVGNQDQFAASYGGMNVMKFRTDNDGDNAIVQRLTLNPTRKRLFNDHLMLFYTHTRRTASQVAATYFDDFNTKKIHFERLHQMVLHGSAILQTGTMGDFGKLLHEAWVEKQALSHQVSNTFIDTLYNDALTLGASGGKLLGAGAGGFILFFVPNDPDFKARFYDKLSARHNVLHIPFKFTDYGSEIVYNDESD